MIWVPYFDAHMKRFSIRLERWHYKRLIWWAAAKGQSVSGMAERTIAARIEANADQIESMIQEEAEDTGMTTAQVKERWLKAANYDPSIFSEGGQPKIKD